MEKAITFLFMILLSAGACAADFTLTGKAIDANDAQPLSYAAVTVDRTKMMTDADGVFRVRLKQGTVSVEISYVGYETLKCSMTIDSDLTHTFALKPSDRLLSEVVITAREGTDASTSSRIDRDAMQHLQPTSFSDLLELLPGNVSKDPNMGGANNITLRETGTVSANASEAGLSNDYAITSLGTAFVVDGAPISTDAAMHGVPDADASSAEGRRSTANRGVDMRTLSTDNIESVEIVRGIPSAEYGNLSSGLVNIKRVNKALPLTGRFKADEYSKLFAVGKGAAIGEGVINADLSYLDSKVDPRDNLENYKRLTGSLRFNRKPARRSIRYSVAVDYTGSFDNAKIDPDLAYNKVDEYKSKYNRMSVTADAAFSSDHASLSSVSFNGAFSYTSDIVERRRQVAPSRASVAPTTMTEGVSEGRYLLGEYIANYKSESVPVSGFLKGRVSGYASVGPWLNDYKAGVEWTLAKNLGKGQIYDLSQPLSASWTTRPRAYCDIPALHTLSFFAEDVATVIVGSSKLLVQGGIRGVMVPSLDKSYIMSGKVYLDPRVNASWTFPAFTVGSRQMSIKIGGGYGIARRLPTIDYLYPQEHYADFVMLSDFDVHDPSKSRLLLMTYVEDATNYLLKPATNHKREVRLDVEWGRNHLTVTCFNERMTDGFRYSTVYTPRSYDKIDPSTGAVTPMTVLNGMSRVTNGSRIDKQGIEFQLNTARFAPIHTSLMLSGAWLRTRYSNSQALYSPVSDVVGAQPVSDLYIGIYDSNDGRINDRFSTSLMADTQIPRWGLTFSSAIQCTWWLRTTRLWESGVPSAYVSTDGVIRPYTAESRKDLMLQYLVKTYASDAFRTIEVPIAMYFNIKATKTIGKWLKMSAFVNKLFDYLPSYKSNGITIRRASDAYFGMEATITI